VREGPPGLSVVASAACDHALRDGVCVCVFLLPGPGGGFWTKGRRWSLWSERRKSNR